MDHHIHHVVFSQTDTQKILNMPASIVSDVEVQQVAEPAAAPAMTVKEISSDVDATTATESLTTFFTASAVNEPTVTSPVLIENSKSIIGTNISDAEEMIMTEPVESLITEIQPVATGTEILEAAVQASETAAPLLGKNFKLIVHLQSTARH